MKKLFGCLALVVLVIIAILLFVLVRNRTEPGTQQQSSSQSGGLVQPTIRIESPANGARVRVGQQFQVHVVANDPRGVASIAFALNGQQGTPIAASSPQTTFAVAIPVVVQSKGIQTIAVQANSASGAKSQPVAVRVVAVQSLSDPTNPGDPPAPVPDVPTDPNLAGGDQSAPSGATVNFAANPSSILQGQCSTLRWDVDGVREVYFEGVGVTGHEQQQECPTQTTTYTLNVVFQDGSARSYTARVDVTGAVVVTGKPDLAITDAHIEPAEVTAGQPFSAVFAIENRGDVAAGPFTLFWQFHEVTGLKNRYSQDFPNGLAAKSSTNGAFQNIVTNSGIGTSPAWVEIDYGNRVDEGAAGEGNNKVSLTLTMKSGTGTTDKPDLMIDNVQVTPTGEPGKVNVIIAYSNHSTAQVSSAFTIRWYPHESTNVVGCSKDVDAASARAGMWSGTVCPYTYAERGEMHWRAVIDTDNDVAESNETNNEKKGTVTIPATGTTFAVTNVAVNVNPSTYNGPCPKTFTTGGKITANGAGTVRYRWERSDGVNSPEASVQFDATGEKSVANYDWQVGTSGNPSIWVLLHVLSPNDKSGKGEAAWTCTGQPGVQVPAAPSNFQQDANALVGKAAFSWKDNSNNEDRFEVQRVSTTSVGVVATTNPGVTNASVDQPPCDVTFQYQVVACNSAGCSPASNKISVKGSCASSGVPAKPVNLTVPSVTATAINLKWDDPATNETRFEIFQTGKSAPVAQTSANDNTAQILNSPCGQSFEFRVRACNAQGCSELSNAATANTPACPPKPIVVTGVKVTITPENFSGPCPYKINYSGTISASGTGTVRYQWILNGEAHPVRELAFDGAATKSVEVGTWTATKTGSYPARLKVLDLVGEPSAEDKIGVYCSQ